jgi:hypothetical protein
MCGYYWTYPGCICTARHGVLRGETCTIRQVIDGNILSAIVPTGENDMSIVGRVTQRNLEIGERMLLYVALTWARKSALITSTAGLISDHRERGS